VVFSVLEEIIHGAKVPNFRSAGINLIRKVWIIKIIYVGNIYFDHHSSLPSLPKIFRGHMRTLYQCISDDNPSSKAAALSLLTAINHFSLTMAKELFQIFNFSFQPLFKLLANRKKVAGYGKSAYPSFFLSSFLLLHCFNNIFDPSISGSFQWMKRRCPRALYLVHPELLGKWRPRFQNVCDQSYWFCGRDFQGTSWRFKGGEHDDCCSIIVLRGTSFIIYLRT